MPLRPQLAPDGETDNELAEERIRFGIGYLALEPKLDDFVCCVRRKPSTC